MPQRFRARVAALVALVAMLAQVTWALAGTTGSITGAVTDAATGKPVAGVKVQALSPSQTATTTTDSAGRFTFASLAPDTYSITFQKSGFGEASSNGNTVQADQNLTVNLGLQAQLQQIGRVSARSSSSLVRPGQTASEYSVTPAQQAAAASLGGGTNLNSAYSAIASVPGVVVPLGDLGWGQSIMIRGGDYTQTGNEVDGIPINRAFDQYASGQLSSLGNQEVQVYTGNAPANAQAVGLAGYVNQVIRTGTYPGTSDATLGIGTPGIYNHANIEFGGATPSRSFSYYVGTGGYSQQLQLLNHSNGAGILGPQGYGSLYNFTAANCGTAHPTVGCYSNSSPYLGGLPFGPNGYNVADSDWGGVPYLQDRETIANLHFGIPHPHDGSRDDVQLLYDYGNVRNYPNTSMFAWGPQYNDVVNGTANNGTIPNLGTCPVTGGTFTGAMTTCMPGVSPAFIDQYQYTGKLNAPFTAANVNSAVPYTFANSPSGRPLGATIDPARQDGETNQFAIVKAQYQHNIGTNGYMRLYGYTLYSDRIDNGMVGLYQSFVGAFPPDYTISAHTHGLAFESGYQLSPQHLLSLNFGYTTSNTVRYNNLTAEGAGQAPVAYLVNSANPAAGCYSAAGAAVYCGSSSAARYSFIPAVTGGPTCGSIICPSKGAPVVGTENGLTCGSGPCEYLAVNAGPIALNNTVVPKFFNASISDTWKPTSRLSVDLSLRTDTFSYVMQDTNTLGNQLFVNSYNATHCISGITITTIAFGATCAAGSSPTNLSAISPNLTYANVLQPRIGATYTMGASDVLRASYGRFVQPAETSSVEATNLQASVPSTAFYSEFGFNSFARTVEPEISFNTDLSWEHQFRGTDLSSRITPFYRKTQNEFATILVDPKTNFIANVNGQNRTATGFELALNKGDFNRNGWAAQLAYTYTYAYSQFKVFPTGGSFVSGINQAIGNYNSYTSFCGSHPGDPRCTAGNAPVAAAAPCYANGTPDPTCSLGGTVANPYFNAPVQSLFDPNAKYFPYNQQVGENADSTSYLVPHVVTLIAQYKKDRLRITPSVQFFGGSRYGTPFSTPGVAPDTCAALAGTAPGSDPRYAGTGLTGGAGYDASSCSGYVWTPNPATKTFDSIGQFVQPNLLNMNLQISYDITPRLTLQVTGANIYANCFGGSNVPWAVGGRVGCGYAAALNAGNFYNPGDAIQPGFNQPYLPVFGAALQSLSQQAAVPFELFAELKITKL